MQHEPFRTAARAATCLLVLLTIGATGASATEPCGDFGECKVLIEINATDGDIGFHFLMDGDDLLRAEIYDPEHRKIFGDVARGALREQGLTETFAESAEPLCWEDPEADEDEEIVTLEEFLDRWEAGPYVFFGLSGPDPKIPFDALFARFLAGEDTKALGPISLGSTELTYDLPAAPSDVDFDGERISWSPGDDLGQCADFDRLADLVADGVLPTHPEDVEVKEWEVVLEPDVEDGDPTGSQVFSIRVHGDITPTEVSVPPEYLASLPDDTPVKVEVGAIGAEDNATFTEEDGFCVNEVDGCED